MTETPSEHRPAASSEEQLKPGLKRAEHVLETVLFSSRWMAKVDFGGLKQKLLASIVAISAIQVLKAFMNIDATFGTRKLGWLAGIHLVFVLSTLLVAWSDRLGGDHGNSGKAAH